MKKAEAHTRLAYEGEDGGQPPSSTLIQWQILQQQISISTEKVNKKQKVFLSLKTQFASFESHILKKGNMDAQLFAPRNTNRKISRGRRTSVRLEERPHSQLCLICRPTEPRQGFPTTEAENFHLHTANVKDALENTRPSPMPARPSHFSELGSKLYWHQLNRTGEEFNSS